MSRKARMRAAAASAVALAIGLAFATGAIHGAWANFQAETQNTGAQASGGWINAPTSLSATPSGYGASFTWNAGTTGVSPFGALSSQQLYYTNEGTTNSCVGATYASTAGSALGGGAGSTSDAESSAVNGDYFCYRLRSTKNTTWWVDTTFSPNPIQVGLVPLSVSYDGGGSITNGTTITITFNQTITFSTGNTDVCVFSGTVILGDASGCAGSGDTAIFGVLSGGTASKTPKCTSSSFGGSGTTTLTVTVGGCPTNGPPGGRAPATMSGTATYVPAGSTLTSSSGGAQQCTISTCNPSLAY